MWGLRPSSVHGNGALSLIRTLYFYQSSAKSLGIDAGDGQRDDVNTRCLQDISKIDISKN